LLDLLDSTPENTEQLSMRFRSDEPPPVEEGDQGCSSSLPSISLVSIAISESSKSCVESAAFGLTSAAFGLTFPVSS
jgi:hypothetical protein